MKIEMCDEMFFRISNDNLNINQEFNTCNDNVVRNNPNIKCYNGEWVKIKVNDYITHKVKPMENLIKIAQLYNLDADKIKQQNELKNDKLFIGQQLKIYR